MKNALMLRALLLVAGAFGVGVGCGMLATPVAFQASAGIGLGSDVNLLNEMRASGGAALGAGALIFLGAFFAALRHTANIVAATLYLSYGASRLISVCVDGMPNAALLAVTAFEIAMGALCALALLRWGAPMTRDAA